MDDLARVVIESVESRALARRTLDPVGPDVVTLREILVDYRRWLGLAPAPAIAIPRALVAAAARIGDAVGGPLNSTALAQLEHGNAGDYDAFRAATGIDCMGWRRALARHPAHAQDRRHARLYFVPALLVAALMLLAIAAAVLVVATFAGSR
jgi:hypothetical protein